MPSLVDVEAMHFRYGKRPSRESDTWTLREVTLSIESDSTLGVVGESGSGKSTLIRVLCGLLHHQQGRVDFDGQPIADWLVKSPKELRRRNQIVFQSPRRSLDPRMRIRRTLAEPVRALERRTPSDGELAEGLARVGLGVEVLSRFPTSCRVGSSNASESPERCRFGPTCCMPTSPSAPSTCRCRRRCSTC